MFNNLRKWRHHSLAKSTVMLLASSGMSLFIPRFTRTACLSAISFLVLVFASQRDSKFSLILVHGYIMISLIPRHSKNNIHLLLSLGKTLTIKEWLLWFSNLIYCDVTDLSWYMADLLWFHGREQPGPLPLRSSRRSTTAYRKFCRP